MIKKDLWIQIIKFGIVGGIATIIDWFVYFLLNKILLINPFLSNLLSFLVSVIYNYIASVKWVFHVNKEKNQKRLCFEFLLFSVIGLFLTEILLWVFMYCFHMDSMVSKIGATIIVMVFNFITRKIFLE